MLPKPDVEVLSQLIDDDYGHYRLRVGQRVHYLAISVITFDNDTMCRPYLLLPKLPDLPDSPWTTMTISRDENGIIVTDVSSEPLPEISTAWHDVHVDVLSVERTRRLRSGVHVVQYNGTNAVAKIACFEWDIPRIEHETWAYSILAQHARQHPDKPIAPEFLGHLTENGRVIGFLLEMLNGEPASVDDLPECEALVGTFHDLGLVHGDVNRYNFLVDRSSKCPVRLVDFEHVDEFAESIAREELLSLPAELAEETGRGGSTGLQ